MSILLRANICSLTAGYGIIYNCAGPGCASLGQLPFADLFCTSDGTTLWCSNQKSCSGSSYVDTFQITIDGYQMIVEDYVVANSTQFTQKIPVQLPLPTSSSLKSKTPSITPRKSSTKSSSKISSTASSPTSPKLLSKSSPTTIHTSSFSSHTTPTKSLSTTLHKRNALPYKLGERAGIKYAKSFFELPDLAVTKFFGTFDAQYSISKDPEGFVKSITSAAKTIGIALQGAVLSPAENVFADLLESRYEDAEHDFLQFVIETTMDTAIVAGAPETGGADLSMLVVTHGFASVLTDMVFAKINQLKDEQETTQPILTATPTPTDTPAPSDTPALITTPQPTPSNGTLLIIRRHREGRGS